MRPDVAAVLFDALADRLQLDPHDRRLAIAAALLHDVGYVRGGRDHHRKSFDVMWRWRSLIVAGVLIGLVVGWVSAPGTLATTATISATNEYHSTIR